MKPSGLPVSDLEGRKPMLRTPGRNSKQPKRLWTPAVLLTLTMLLAGCASLTQETSPGTPTRSGSAACLSLSPIVPNRGKPGGASTEDVAAALDRDRPIERVRNLVGDTAPTLTQIDKNNAALKVLCGGTNVEALR